MFLLSVLEIQPTARVLLYMYITLKDTFKILAAVVHAIVTQLVDILGRG